MQHTFTRLYLVASPYRLLARPSPPLKRARRVGRAAGATDVLDKSAEMERMHEVIDAAVSRSRN